MVERAGQFLRNGRLLHGLAVVHGAHRALGGLPGGGHSGGRAPVAAALVRGVALAAARLRGLSQLCGGRACGGAPGSGQV